MPDFIDVVRGVLGLAIVAFVVRVISQVKLISNGRVWRNVITHPLRKIPGPVIAALTDQYLVLYDMAGFRTRMIHSLHQKYGPVVRIAPNEISFSDKAVVKEIYGQSTKVIKAPIYDSFPPGVFSMRKKEQHRERRKYMSHVFSFSHLAKVESVIQDKVKELVDVIEELNGKPLNVLEFFRMLAFDIISALCFGDSYNSLQSRTPPKYLKDLDRVFLLSGIELQYPLMRKLLPVLPLKSVQEFIGSVGRVQNYGANAYNDYLAKYGRLPDRKDLISKLISAATTGEAEMNDADISVEASNMIFAGTDTTSNTLTYLFYEMAINPEWQSRLREELKSVESHSDGPYQIPQWTSVSNLEVLDAVVKEALRLHSAAPASLWREVPESGLILGGHFIPEKTVVSMQCYTTHRDPDVFPEPEEYDPSRWLQKDRKVDPMNELFMPFSKGSRACLGINLAYMELKVTVATLVGRYQVSLASDMQAHDMDMRDHFLIFPRGGKCNLVFHKV